MALSLMRALFSNTAVLAAASDSKVTTAVTGASSPAGNTDRAVMLPQKEKKSLRTLCVGGSVVGAMFFTITLEQ